MSVQTEIDRIIGAVEAAHLKVAQKGGTTNRPYLVGNLEDAIDTIPVGSTEDLDSEIAAQKQLISDIQTALAGKVAGGAKIATGIISTDENGEALFDCGFEPDVIYLPDFTWSEELEVGTSWHNVILSTTSLKNTGDFCNVSFETLVDGGMYMEYSVVFMKEENGLRCVFSTSYEPVSTQFRYIAINYTSTHLILPSDFTI